MHMFNCIGLIAIGKGSGCVSKWGYPIPFDDYHILPIKINMILGYPQFRKYPNGSAAMVHHMLHEVYLWAQVPKVPIQLVGHGC